LNKELSFSTSRTNQICEKFLKVQFTPSWTWSKPYFTTHTTEPYSRCLTNAESFVLN